MARMYLIEIERIEARESLKSFDIAAYTMATPNEREERRDYYLKKLESGKSKEKISKKEDLEKILGGLNG